MSLAKRISEHPVLSLTVSAATILSTVLAIIAFIGPRAPAAESATGDTPRAVEVAESALVGTWALQTPPDLGWTVTYRANGTFTLVTPDGAVDGFYEAKNGVFTTSAPESGSSDGGTYRFINETTLEMNGQLGVSVWGRVQGT